MNPTFLAERVFRKCALPLADSLPGDPDSRSWFQVLYLEAGFHNCAGEVAADNVRKAQVHRYGATADVSINGIDVHGSDFDEAFARPGLGSGQIAVANDFRRAGFVDVSRFHCPFPFCMNKV